MTSNDTKKFRTSEFILICALAYHGEVIESFESDPINPRRAVAVFVYSKDLDAIQAKLFARELSVEPIRSWNLVRELKGDIRNALERKSWN
jgi:hypothetical protein